MLKTAGPGRNAADQKIGRNRKNAGNGRVIICEARIVRAFRAPI